MSLLNAEQGGSPVRKDLVFGKFSKFQIFAAVLTVSVIAGGSYITVKMLKSDDIAGVDTSNSPNSLTGGSKVSLVTGDRIDLNNTEAVEQHVMLASLSEAEATKKLMEEKKVTAKEAKDILTVSRNVAKADELKKKLIVQQKKIAEVADSPAQKTVDQETLEKEIEKNRKELEAILETIPIVKTSVSAEKEPTETAADLVSTDTVVPSNTETTQVQGNASQSGNIDEPKSADITVEDENTDDKTTEIKSTEDENADATGLSEGTEETASTNEGNVKTKEETKTVAHPYYAKSKNEMVFGAGNKDKPIRPDISVVKSKSKVCSKGRRPPTRKSTIVAKSDKTEPETPEKTIEETIIDDKEKPEGDIKEEEKKEGGDEKKEEKEREIKEGQEEGEKEGEHEKEEEKEKEGKDEKKEEKKKEGKEGEGEGEEEEDSNSEDSDSKDSDEDVKERDGSGDDDEDKSDETENEKPSVKPSVFTRFKNFFGF